MPLVSVVIPTYDRAAMVVEAVNSVLAQSLSDLEVLVVDDGSTDDTESAVRSLRDSRLRYMAKGNGGPGAARNFGIAQVAGKYLAFLDSDDLWPPNYLAVMVGRLEERRDFGGAYSAIRVFNGDGGVEETRVLGDRSGWIAADLFRRGFIWPSGSVFRSAVWKDFRFDEALNKTCEDGDAFLRLSLREQFLFVPESR